jgi:hypothetical protein
MNRIGQFIGKLGGKLGIAVCFLGFVAIFLGWNGAASFNDLRQQFPYLVSGGITGLALVVVGAALLLIESMRTERAELQATLLELRDALEHSGGSVGSVTTRPVLLQPDGAVVAGASSYHEPSCRLVDGRDDLEVLPSEDAAAQGLAPCRICQPGGSEYARTNDDGARRRQLRAN